jgi:hypothetical protein
MAEIENYRFKHIEVDGETYTIDVIIHPDRIIPEWWRKSSHEVLPEDLEQYLDEFPELFIIGTGKFGRMQVPDKTEQWLEEQGTEVIQKKTKAACQEYNNSDKSITGAALHLTC